MCLFVILISLVVDNVEEAELVNALGGGDNAEPVTELLLLEELLGAAYTVRISIPNHSLSSLEMKTRDETYRYFK